MVHPQMYDDEDPYLARVRALALGFPAATEVVAHGRPTFRTGRMFAVYGATTKAGATLRRDYPRGLLVLPEPEDRVALAQDPRAFVPAYFAPAGWVGIDLSVQGHREVDWQEVVELLDSSYRQVAPRRLLARLAAEGGPAGHPDAPAPPG